MSNISRRDFLKTAGVMTLAVAAAGVLAGCEGNAAKPEVPEVTNVSVTANNYTLTLKDTKQFAIQNHNADGETTSEDRYVVALLNLKAVDEAKAVSTDKPFTLITKSNNVDLVTSFKNVNEVDLADVKELFDLKLIPGGVSSMNMVMPGYNGVETRADGKDYVAVFKVKKVTVTANKEWEFKTPTLSFVVQDQTGLTYTKMDATIPAAEVVKKNDLIKEK